MLTNSELKPINPHIVWPNQPPRVCPQHISIWVWCILRVCIQWSIRILRELSIFIPMAHQGIMPTATLSSRESMVRVSSSLRTRNCSSCIWRSQLKKVSWQLSTYWAWPMLRAVSLRETIDLHWPGSGSPYAMGTSCPIWMRETFYLKIGLELLRRGVASSRIDFSL